MVPFCRLLDALNEVPDPRRAEGKRYPLAPLLLFSVLALLSGATSYRRIIIFLDPRRTVLNEVFGVALKRAPSVNTLRTVLQELDGDALEQAFRRHAEGLLATTGGGRGRSSRSTARPWSETSPRNSTKTRLTSTMP